MTVKRYRVRCKSGVVTLDPHGAWVDYNDYANLEARLAEAERRLTLIREIAANTIGHKEIRLANIVTVIDAPDGVKPDLSWGGATADSADGRETDAHG